MNMPNHTRKQRIIAWRLWDRTRRYGHGIADASGAALIEFALILPVFIGIIFGLIEV
ncbi:MAG: TadE/TadG family type IV pilus assembly protein, partial [Kiloniellales bacterium]